MLGYSGPLDVNLTSTCNVGCHCDSSLDAQFVCDKETQTTFFSACHAGCEGGNNTRCRCKFHMLTMCEN